MSEIQNSCVFLSLMFQRTFKLAIRQIGLYYLSAATLYYFQFMAFNSEFISWMTSAVASADVFLRCYFCG